MLDAGTRPRPGVTVDPCLCCSGNGSVPAYLGAFAGESELSVKHLNPYVRESSGRYIAGSTKAWDRVRSVILEIADNQRNDQSFVDCAAVDSR